MKLPKTHTVRLSGRIRRIAFDDKIWSMLENDVDQKRRTKLKATMQIYCDQPLKFLPKERFRFERFYSNAGKRVRLEAFKGWQIRVYGAACDTQINENERLAMGTFLVTGMDTKKKANKAKNRILDAAESSAFSLIHGKWI